MPNVTIRDYAEARHVSRQAVEKAIRDGRLAGSVVSRDPILLDRYHADREWAANSNPIKGGAHRRRADGSPATASETAQAALDLAGDDGRARRGRRARDDDAGDDDDLGGDHLGDRLNLAREKALKARIDRQLAELNLQRAQGLTVPLDAAKRLWFARWRAFRDRIMAIGDDLADTLAVTSDPDECARMLHDAHAAALGELPPEPPPAEEAPT